MSEKVSEKMNDIERDIDTLLTAINELDDLTYHRPNGIAMQAQAALMRLADLVRVLLP